MRRREFTSLLGGATVAWSVAAHAQQTERVRRIGVLTFSAESDPEGQSSVAAFRRVPGRAWEARLDGGPQQPHRDSLGGG